MSAESSSAPCTGAARRVLVLKFGGTSLASPARVRMAARRVGAHVRRSRRVVAVVSAAGGATDAILRRAGAVQGQGGTAAGVAQGAHGALPEIARELDGGAGAARAAQRAAARELDRALATGEDRAAALLALSLNALGVPARSLRGGEAGIVADGHFGGGRIEAVDADWLLTLFSAGVVPVVSGFQGQRLDGETVTLGRGASDATAVALAAALGAECHIVTDVAAVYDRDPNAHLGARRLARLEHDELLALAVKGARVIQEEAARLAAAAAVPLRIYAFDSPLSGRGGTIVETRRPGADARPRAVEAA